MRFHVNLLLIAFPCEGIHEIPRPEKERRIDRLLFAFAFAVNLGKPESILTARFDLRKAFTSISHLLSHVDPLSVAFPSIVTGKFRT